MFQRRFCVLLASAAAAFGVWKWTPGTALDRAVFSAVSSSFVNGPLFVSGEGTHASPWQLRSFSAEAKPDERQAPVIVSLGDDLEGFFQSSPPAPIDIAVVFKNFQRLGARKAASATVLSWEAPDPIGLAALERALGGFDSLVMAAPLSRGPIPGSMPPSFRRASLPLEAVHGDSSLIPVVNRIPIPGIILAGENTIAGFSILESEAAARSIPLFARWEDRVVLSFPLLTVLQRLNLPPEKLEIQLGKFLRIGPSGPIVPIDEFGRLHLPGKPLPAYAEISAEALIDGGDELFPKLAPDPVILRDDRSSLEPSVRDFSRNLSMVVAALASEDGLSGKRSFPRLSRDWEIGILSALAVILAGFFGTWLYSRQVLALAFAGACVAAQWIGIGMAGIWLPGMALFSAVLAAYLVTMLLGAKAAVPVVAAVSPEARSGGVVAAEKEPNTRVSSPEPGPVDEVVEPEEDLPSEPLAIPAATRISTKGTSKSPAKATSKPPAKKASAKKAVAKKSPPKKSAAPKSSPKSPRSKKPPGEAGS